MKYICELCGTCYDEQVGDPQRGIPAGTAFQDLPAHYECACCGSEREAFSPVGEKPPAAPSKGRDTGFWQDANYTDEHRSSDR